MSCERPVKVRNPQGGLLNAKCGTCRPCLIEDITDWSMRLKNENKHCFNGYFITLTYSDDFCDGNLHKEHYQVFMQNLRNNIRGKNIMPEEFTPLRYFAVGEYGGETERPHYHAIIFNIPETDPVKLKILISNAWEKGHIVLGDLNDKTIHYTCKYIFKQKLWKGDRPKPFRLMSTRPAIGNNYLNSHIQYHYEGDRFYYLDHGIKRHLPRYYRKKMFDDDRNARLAELSEELQRQKSDEACNRTAQENISITLQKVTIQEQQFNAFAKKMKKGTLN